MRDLRIDRFSSLRMSGGTVEDDLEVLNGGQAFVSGGVFGEDIEVVQGSFAQISGGSF